MFEYHSIALLERTFTTAPEQALAPGRRFVELQVTDVERLAEAERKYGRRGNIPRMMRRFHFGCRWFAIPEGDTPVAWCWMTAKSRYLDECQWLFELGANDVWIRDLFCAPAFRGQRLMEALLWDAWAKLGRPQRYFSDVATNNRSSMRLHG